MKESGINSKNKIENFIKEIEILSELNSPYIIKLYHINLYGEYCKSDGRIKKVVYYVMELEKNCELFDFLDLTDNFPESLARFFFKQLIAGIKF